MYAIRSYYVRGVGAPNLLPHLDRPNYDGARKAIAELFMTRIIEGKGLAELASRCADEISYNFV